MTSTPPAPVVDPGPPPPAPPGTPRGADRFFAWVAGLGVARADGWLGGVCAGLAARMRIDPLIVRGIFVVVALFGIPVLFLYAVAWALLPDVEGRIHLQELFRGCFDPAIVGIGILVLVSLVPIVPWTMSAILPTFWVLQGPVGWDGFGVVGTILGLAVVAGLVVLIVRAARTTNPPGAAAPDPRTASADSADPGIPAAAADSGDAAAAGGPGSDAAEGALVALAASGPAPEPLLAPSATPDEIAQWRAQHEAWKVQDDAWRRQQQDAERAARDQARRERKAAGAAFAAEADERRRIRRATKPRTSLAFVATVIGLALVAGAGSSLWALAIPIDDAGFAAAIGLFAAALVVAVGMVVAGVVRRRSGFLAFVATCLLVSGAIATAVPSLQSVSFGNAYLNNVSGPFTLTQPFGSLSVELVGSSTAHPIVIEKGSGDTYVEVSPEVELQLSAKLRDGDVNWIRVDPRNGEVLSSGTWRGLPTSDGSTRVQRRVSATATESRTVQPLTIEQASGDLVITIYAFDTEETP